mmetsp:Transcript_14439/g.16145  ORF Transcript_14439/g.16145 Transcript_14439/m.16145 type:complete len:170 (+) Transcript_14439:134-643(+)
MEVWLQKESGEDWLYFDLLFNYPLPTYQQNLWLAVGFGVTSMDSADIVICRFILNEGKCTDRHNGRFPVTPVEDEIQDVTRFRSEAVYDQFVTMGFKRKVSTGDISDDYLFQLGNQTDLIWSYGEVNSTTQAIEKHIAYGVSSIVMPAFAVNLLGAFYSSILGLNMIIY